MQFCDKLARSLRVKVFAKRPREKHMLEAEELSAKLYFARTSRDRPSHEVPTKLFTQRILSVIFLSFTHTIYTLITHKIKKEAIQNKTLEKFLQHTHLIRESYSFSIKKSLQSILFSLSHCCTLRGDLYQNTNHTYSECRECFGAWEVLGFAKRS